MRIIAGNHRGRILRSPKGLETRPTGDKIRGAIFNKLTHTNWLKKHVFPGALVLDVFAGTGALGLEALSRGAEHVVFIEKNRHTAMVCEQNIALCREEENSGLRILDVLKLGKRPLNTAPRNLIFLDPPYGKNLGSAALEHLTKMEWVATAAIVIMEMEKKALEPDVTGYTLQDERDYGRTRIRFLTRT